MNFTVNELIQFSFFSDKIYLFEETKLNLLLFASYFHGALSQKGNVPD